MDPRDHQDPDVIEPAKDLYDAFVDDYDDAPLSSVPEGDEDGSFLPADPLQGTSESEGVQAIEAPVPYKTQSGRTVKPVIDPMVAATAASVPLPRDRMNPHKKSTHRQNQYFAGGVANESVRAG